MSFERAVVAGAVGTSTRPVDLAALPDALRPPGPESRSAAAGLLDAAALHAVAVRGSAGLVDGAVETPALGPERRPLPTERWAAALRQALGARAHDVAVEALVGLDGAGLRLPEDLLVPVLALPAAAATHGVVPGDVLGVRGDWLRRMEPFGPWVLGAPATDDSDEVWAAGTTTERAAWLGRLHRTDPERARGLLDQTWTREDRTDREALLAALGESPTAADDAVVERALDDRAADVRALARTLAPRVPGGAYGRRMADRVRAVTEHGLLGRLRIRADEIAADDRDGVPDPAKGAAATLARVVAGVPLDAWPELAGRPAAGLVGRPVGDDLTLDEGLATAAVRERDVAVADAIARRIAADGSTSPNRVRAAALASARPRTEAVLALLVARKKEWVGLLAHEPWPVDLVDPVLHAVGAVERHSDLPAVLEAMVRLGPVTELDLAARVRALAAGEDFPKNLRTRAYAAAMHLDLRRTLALELKEPR